MFNEIARSSNYSRRSSRSDRSDDDSSSDSEDIYLLDTNAREELRLANNTNSRIPLPSGSHELADAPKEARESHPKEAREQSDISDQAYSSDEDMVGKKTEKALRLEGLERTDNELNQSSWPTINPINQKNYYVDYMKHDYQVLATRIQNENNTARMIKKAKDIDRAKNNMEDGDVELEDEEIDANDMDASKVIVIHPGSQNLRIGLASDALPKTIPMVLAQLMDETESQVYEPCPRRLKDTDVPEEKFGEDFAKIFSKASNDLKSDMRANKRKVLPNSKELVVNFNRRTPPDTIPEHNDPIKMEWTDVSKKPRLIAGHSATRIADNSNPSYRLYSPIQHGYWNEAGYQSERHMCENLDDILHQAFKVELGIATIEELSQYSCVFVIPDLYDKHYVETVLRILMIQFEFKKVCFIQESLSASFGAGYTQGCIVDVGAQKTSICCVEEGLCIEDSRVNLKYGGYDVTETFIKMMIFDHFPYADINLKRRYDFLLAEELKKNYCTMNQAEISVQLYNFHLRAPNSATRKYQFKTYDEVILAPMGFYDPSIFDNSKKLKGRRKLVMRSYNQYDTDLPDDPVSAAQLAVLNSIKPSFATSNTTSAPTNGDLSTPMKDTLNPMNHLGRFDSQATPGTSTAGSPAPETSTPIPFSFGANGNGGTPVPSAPFVFGNANKSESQGPPPGMFVGLDAKSIAAERDSILPIAPLDTAVITSIYHAAKGDDRKFRDLIGSIMVIGGGAKIPGFGPVLEERLKRKRPDLADKVLVGTSPREMDGQVVVWKGASIICKLTSNDSWISPLEYERLDSRILYTKCIFNY